VSGKVVWTLRWTRALCKFNWGKGEGEGVPRLRCGAWLWLTKTPSDFKINKIR